MKLLASATLALSLLGSVAHAATDIDFFFPVPVQGKLATEMQSLVAEFNKAHPEINVTPVYTGSYDDTNLKTRAAIQAGHPPAAVIMSANFVREYVINHQTMAMDKLIESDKLTPDSYMARFWPALRVNAMENGHVYGVPFQNSTPLLYINDAAFKEVGLDPSHPPTNWTEWLAAMKKLTKTEDGKTTRYGLMFPGTYDYLGWITSGLIMANGGQYYNPGWGGEVYYNTPSAIGAVTFIDNMVNRDHVMPPGVTDASAVSNGFFSGRAAMVILSTGSLTYVRENMKQPYSVAFLPGHLDNAAPIGGASLIIPEGNSAERQQAAWTLINWLTSPEVAGRWSRFTGYFAPRVAAYDLPEMKSFIAAHPDAKVALDQLQYARPWFATYNTVAVRKALEDQVQAVLSGREKPAAAMEKAQKEADRLMKPYVDQTALNVPK